MRVDHRYEDDRAERRSRTGITVGAATGAAVGVTLGVLTPGITDGLGAVLGILLGAAVGAFLGRAVAAHVMVDDWEPSPGERSFVGTRAPDDDTTNEPGRTPGTT